MAFEGFYSQLPPGAVLTGEGPADGSPYSEGQLVSTRKILPRGDEQLPPEAPDHALTDYNQGILDNYGSSVTEVDPGEFYSLNTARSVANYENDVGTTVQPVTWDDPSVYIEIINDDVNITVYVAFGSSSVAAAASSTSLQNAHTIKPKETRRFDVHTKALAYIASAASAHVRTAIGLPTA